MAESIFTADARFAPWWWESAPPLSAQDDPELPARTDVAVVGAGYTGLSAALTLARAGRSVVVLEAGAPGQGASTRNGGMIGSGHRLSFADLARRCGRKRAAEILREGIASLEFAADLIAREAIACHFVRCGRFRAAWRPRHYDTMAREVEVLRREIGLEADVLPRAEQQREVGTHRYHGGVLYHRHGALHPALLHRGLLERATGAGALVIGHTPVAGIAGQRGGFVLRTARGSLSAREVVVATNGYTGAATPALRRRMLPLSSYMIATEPLAPELVTKLIPGGRMIVETRARHCYYRASPDGRRILFGGRAALRPIAPAAGAPRLHRLMSQLFPELAAVRVSHAWSGAIAFPRDFMPHLGILDGVHYALGYCGSGVAMAPYLGHKIALRLLGRAEGATAFDGLPFPAVPLHRARGWLLPALDAYYRVLDRIEGSG